MFSALIKGFDGLVKSYWINWSEWLIDYWLRYRLAPAFAWFNLYLELLYDYLRMRNGLWNETNENDAISKYSLICLIKCALSCNVDFIRKSLGGRSSLVLYCWHTGVFQDDEDAFTQS